MKALHVPGVAFVRQVGDICEYSLAKNGLRILIKPEPGSPAVGLMVTYHVGSRNEGAGYTGATHLLEHLMFKGTKSFPKEAGVDLLEAKGAQINATTWMDRTNYYEVIPSSLLSFALQLEASRMREAIINEKDKASEMPVVWNEFDRGENMPLQALDKLMWSTAFQAHPYHHSTIGWRSDIENVSIERLQQFYDDFYWPNNATLTLVGGFDEKKSLERIVKYFGKLLKSPKPIPPMYTVEPSQEGERRVVIERTGANIVGIGYKIPDAHHEDIPALIMLVGILDGHNQSRLHTHFIDSALATSVRVDGFQTRDPGLLTAYITFAHSIPHGKIEKEFKHVIHEIQTKGVTASELTRLRRFVRKSMAEKRDGVYSTLSTLNEDIASGDWTHFIHLPNKLMKVTPKDIKRVAQKYLIDSQSTVGWFKGRSL